MNKYNHRLSRKGYNGLMEEMEQSLGTSVDDIDRSVLWKMARQTENDEYADDATKEVAMRIDELTKQVKDGSISTEGATDVLTMALGTSERSGCVRAAGPFITPTTYFHIPRRGSSKYIRELEDVKRTLQSKLEEEQNKRKQQGVELYESQQKLRELEEKVNLILQKGVLTTEHVDLSSISHKSDNKKQTQPADSGIGVSRIKNGYKATKIQNNKKQATTKLSDSTVGSLSPKLKNSCKSPFV